MRAADFPSPRVRHNTVGAEIVAALHDRHVAFKRVLSIDRQIFNQPLIVIVNFDCPTAGFNEFLQQLRKMFDVVRPEDDIDLRIFFFNLFDNGRLLHHAAADRQNEIRVFLFDVFKIADIAEKAFVRVFPDTAGVHHHNASGLFVVCRRVAHFLQHT